MECCYVGMVNSCTRTGRTAALASAIVLIGFANNGFHLRDGHFTTTFVRIDDLAFRAACTTHSSELTIGLNVEIKPVLLD